MDTMPLVADWRDLALRLGLTVVAGLLIGFNRGEHGHAAGLRTTLLVALAAAIAMIQMNLLLRLTGKTPDSFVNADPMRLPLGILSGIGFIGAGAILRRGDMVHGVTTAATLWITTVIGLCFGGGQLALGVTGLVLILLALWVLKWAEARMPQEQHATLAVTLEADEPSIPAIVDQLKRAGYKSKIDMMEIDEAGRQHIDLELSRHGRSNEQQAPMPIEALANLPGVVALKWSSHAAPPV
ncbi:MAG: putative rane protein [Rhodospirillales bacterium]|nr:putative rane protein [Rhodospirillales bacterium]